MLCTPAANNPPRITAHSWCEHAAFVTRTRSSQRRTVAANKQNYITKLIIVMIALRSAVHSASVQLNMEQTEQRAQLPCVALGGLRIVLALGGPLDIYDMPRRHR